VLQFFPSLGEKNPRWLGRTHLLLRGREGKRGKCPADKFLSCYTKGTAGRGLYFWKRRGGQRKRGPGVLPLVQIKEGEKKRGFIRALPEPWVGAGKRKTGVL